MSFFKKISGYFGYVLQAIVAIESVVGAGNGASKKQILLDSISAGAKVGETVPEDHVAAISVLADVIVATLNATGLLGFKKTPSAPANP